MSATMKTFTMIIQNTIPFLCLIVQYLMNELHSQYLNLAAKSKTNIILEMFFKKKVKKYSLHIMISLPTTADQICKVKVIIDWNTIMITKPVIRQKRKVGVKFKRFVDDKANSKHRVQNQRWLLGIFRYITSGEYYCYR